MTKTLKSGLKVIAKDYYELLEWKDKNLHESINSFEEFQAKHNTPQSINLFNKKQYDQLKAYIKWLNHPLTD